MFGEAGYRPRETRHWSERSTAPRGRTKDGTMDAEWERWSDLAAFAEVGGLFAPSGSTPSMTVAWDMVDCAVMGCVAPQLVGPVPEGGVLEKREGVTVPHRGMVVSEELRDHKPVIAEVRLDRALAVDSPRAAVSAGITGLLAVVSRRASLELGDGQPAMMGRVFGKVYPATEDGTPVLALRVRCDVGLRR